MVSDCGFYIIITRLEHIFVNQNRNHYNQHIFCQTEILAYFCNVKIHASGFNKLLERLFCLLLAVELFSL